MDIAVIGAGYVGLVQASGLADLGHQVRLAEASPDRIEILRRAELPIFEPGLHEMFERGLSRGLITLHSDNVEASAGTDLVFLALPTPAGDGGKADLRIVEQVVDELVPGLGPDTILVLKSTVPVGTALRLQARVREAGWPGAVASNPEFLSEGNAVDDFFRAERVVVGAVSPADARRVAEVYRTLPARIVITDPSSAELIKYASNCYLATRLTFANSIANLAEHVGADVVDVLEAVGLDRRIGPHFLKPGPGYGGSCFPKDVAAMVALSEEAGYDFALLRTVVAVDELQRTRIVERAQRLVGGDLRGRRVGLWGVAFKAGTDDIRESPALKIGQALAGRGAVVVAHDPRARTTDLTMAADPIAAAAGAELLVVATEWADYATVDLAEVAKAMLDGAVVYDARNLLDPEAVRQAGLRYVGVGRGREDVPPVT